MAGLVRRSGPIHKFYKQKDAFGKMDLGEEREAAERAKEASEEFIERLRECHPEREGVNTQASTSVVRPVFAASSVGIRSSADW